MALKGDAKFERKLTRGLKTDIRNWANFHVSSQKSKNLHFYWILLFKPCKVLDEKIHKSYVSWHSKVIHSLKKNWLLVPKMTWEIWWISMRAIASLKICTLMCYFFRKYIMYEPKKYKGVMHNSTEKRCKIWGEKVLCFEIWHEKFSEFWPST